MPLKSFNMPKMPSVQIRMIKMPLRTSSKSLAPEWKVLSPAIIDSAINPPIQRTQIILLHWRRMFLAFACIQCWWGEGWLLRDQNNQGRTSLFQRTTSWSSSSVCKVHRRAGPSKAPWSTQISCQRYHAWYASRPQYQNRLSSSKSSESCGPWGHQWNGWRFIQCIT